ncbi:MAG: hypothetical protein ACOX7I_00845 [Oscillospiraceae bacterium]|jgi:hypothetical protein
MARTLFDYEDNRLEYGGLLMPDIGYDVDFAVAFTYSLDLEALLGVPVSLGLLDSDMDTGLIDNPFFLLEAIRKSSDKIAIFCNAGSISLPRNIRSVFALLESSVFEVNLNGMNSFHPKMWFIKYTNDNGDSYIKLIVLSRNLTFDRSFDYAVEMTGQIGNRKQGKNKPLSDMLQFAAKYAGTQKRKKILALAEDILCVKNFELDDRFEDYEFLPLGITPDAAENTGLFDGCYDLIVFSPFLSSNMAESMANNARYRKTLFTRKSSLNRKIIGLYDGVYITKDIVMDNEIMSEGEAEPRGCDIHAKLYFTRGNNGNFLYVGSANASDKAFYNNVEFLLRLKYKPYMTSYDALLKEFLPEDGCPFERIADIVTEEQAEDTSLLDKSFREALRSIKNATVAADGERFSITLRTNGKPFEKAVYIAPLFRAGSFAPLADGLVFPDMLLKELSEFFIIKIEDKQIVTKIALVGIPEGRDQAIYKSIIQDKNGFLAYVSFMLSDNYSESCFEQYEIAKRLLNDADMPQSVIPGALYERMLSCTVNNPYRLLDLDNLMSKLDEDIVGDFITMYQPFKEIAKRMIR